MKDYYNNSETTLLYIINKVRVNMWNKSRKIQCKGFLPSMCEGEAEMKKKNKPRVAFWLCCWVSVTFKKNKEAEKWL
jgi:hypothetical protein